MPGPTATAPMKQTVRTAIEKRYRRWRALTSTLRPGSAVVIRIGGSAARAAREAMPPCYAAPVPRTRASRLAQITKQEDKDDQPHLPTHRDRRHLARGDRPGDPQRGRACLPDLAPHRLVRGHPGARPGPGRRDRALPGRHEDRFPPRGRVRYLSPVRLAGSTRG